MTLIYLASGLFRIVGIVAVTRPCAGGQQQQSEHELSCAHPTSLETGAQEKPRKENQPVTREGLCLATPA